MMRNKPPFRADVVGSILRTAPLKEARAKREKGEISAAQLTEVEDREVETIINVRAAKAGFKIVEVPSFEQDRLHGLSNLNAWRDGKRVLKAIMSERFSRLPEPSDAWKPSFAELQVTAAANPNSSTTSGHHDRRVFMPGASPVLVS